MHMTDAERREVARRLRRLQSHQFRDEDRPEITTWDDIGAAVLDSETWGKCVQLRSRDNRTRAVRSVIAGRLADLIEPEPERTCRVGCYPPGYEDNLHYEVCSECGTILTASRPGDRHAARASYCPECGRRALYDSNDYI